MSTVTSWLWIGVLVVTGLFCANAIVYRARYGTFLRTRDGERSPLERKLATSDVIAGVFVCFALLTAVAWPVVAPATAFAVWLREPYALPVYAVWCWVIATAIAIGPKVFELLRGKTDV